ncbi:hypothetical protein ACLB2K_073063 [Fragaria x ananassa]
MEENVNQVEVYQPRNQRSESYSNTCNPGWKNHPNSSWRDQRGSSSALQGGKQSFRGGQGQDSSNFAHYGNAHQGSTHFSPHGQYGQHVYGPNSQGHSTSSHGFHGQNTPPGFTQGVAYSGGKFQGNSSSFQDPNLQRFPTQAPSEPKKPNLEDLMGEFLKAQNSTNEETRQWYQTLKQG